MDVEHHEQYDNLCYPNSYPALMHLWDHEMQLHILTQQLHKGYEQLLPHPHPEVTDPTQITTTHVMQRSHPQYIGHHPQEPLKQYASHPAQ